MHNLQTEYAYRIRNECIKSKEHERNITGTCQPRVSGVRLGVTLSKGLYTRYLRVGSHLRAVFRIKGEHFGPWASCYM